MCVCVPVKEVNFQVPPGGPTLRSESSQCPCDVDPPAYPPHTLDLSFLRCIFPIYLRVVLSNL